MEVMKRKYVYDNEMLNETRELLIVLSMLRSSVAMVMRVSPR